MQETTASDTHVVGLNGGEVADRVARGDVNVTPAGPARTVQEILRANLLTRFNFLLGSLLVVILIVGPIQDALFGFVLIVNTAIGIIQELRAKRTLDRLAVLNAPEARVIRSGTAQTIPLEEVVRDDVLEVRAGDQIIVDGPLISAVALEIDESLLTGESDPIHKRDGDVCLSGSFVVAGTGRYQAERIGEEAYAAKLALEARRFALAHSELRAGIDRILTMVSWAIVPVAGLLLWSQLGAADSLEQAARGAVAGVVGMVPQGLVLLTSIAFAVSVVRLGRLNVLVQELQAVEGLARVDIVCFDKTGTLTEGQLAVQDVRALDGSADIDAALGAVAAADPTPNSTRIAITDRFRDPTWRVAHSVPFSSDRKWSGACFPEHGTWVLGAPEVVAAESDEVLEAADAVAKQGQRVLILARSSEIMDRAELPAELEPVGMVVLGDDIRTDAESTLDFFARQGVAPKVVSGDHPSTVGAIGERVGLGRRGESVDARHLPKNDSDLADVLERTTMFGRVTPHQKRDMVESFQSRGHTVSMTGDGVNDVLALKQADIGVAMGSGSQASRSVAQLVLLGSEFRTMPLIVEEGRRVIANIERVANLFVTKTVYAMLLAILVGVVGLAFPFLPRHLTLVGSLTIGIPGFFLALEHTSRRARPGFLRRVLLFAAPTGTLAAGATFWGYGLAIEAGVSLPEAQTTATVILMAMGYYALILVSRPLTRARRIVISTMILLGVAVVTIPPLRDFFALDLPPPLIWLASIGIVALTGALIYLALRSVGWMRLFPDVLRAPLELLRSGAAARLIKSGDASEAEAEVVESSGVTQLSLPLDEE